MTTPKKPRKRLAKKVAPPAQTPVEAQEPIKQRVEIAQDGTAAVIDSKPGPVTLADRLKSYYHTAITIVGTLLAAITLFTPVVNELGGDSSIKKYVTVAILFLTALVNFLKSNEHWVESV